jgi:hypothetical protein
MASEWPQHLKVQILEHFHDSPFSEHMVFKATLVSIRNRYVTFEIVVPIVGGNFFFFSYFL